MTNCNQVHLHKCRFEVLVLKDPICQKSIFLWVSFPTLQIRTLRDSRICRPPPWCVSIWQERDSKIKFAHKYDLQVTQVELSISLSHYFKDTLLHFFFEARIVLSLHRIYLLTSFTTYTAYSILHQSQGNTFWDLFILSVIRWNNKKKKKHWFW